jgi:hypothetical protein
MTLSLQAVELRGDPQAAAWVKRERVEVVFAAQDGALMSKVGPNHYRAGDALVTGVDGDTWCVTRDRFDAKYVPADGQPPGTAGTYRNLPVPVLAKRMAVEFRVQRTAGGDWLEGRAGDWLLQYAPGDHGICAAARFAQVYHRVDATP